MHNTHIIMDANLSLKGVPYGFSPPPATIFRDGVFEGEGFVHLCVVEAVGDDAMRLRVQSL